MEHMRQFDWCNTTIESENFVEAADLANSCTEKILQNRFIDPLISSDDEDDDDKDRPVVDWDDVFANSELDGEGGSQKDNFLFYVPGDKQLPPFPKLSSLSSAQHFQMLKVVCSQNPTVLESLFFPKPMKLDYRLFEDLKEKYEKEQQEYIQWAATLWTGGHNIRALRPNPLVESGYLALSRVRLHAAQCWPKSFNVAAQIPLASANVDETCKLTPLEELIKVNLTELPHVQTPDYARRLSIMRPCELPEPCNKHPSRFILPGENSVSILPLSEVHRELCEFALGAGASGADASVGVGGSVGVGASEGAAVVASEAACRTLVERDRSWTLPITVCQVMGDKGEKINVVALDKEITTQKEPSTIRTYKAFKHLLLQSLIPPEEKVRMLNYWNKVDAPEVLPTPATKPKSAAATPADHSDSDDDDADENNLVIDMDEMELGETDNSTNKLIIDDNQSETESEQADKQSSDTKQRKSITKKRTSTTERRNSIAEKRNSTSEKINSITEKRSSITEKRNSITEKRNSITEKRGSITEKRNSITEQRNSINEKQNGDGKDMNNTSENNKSCDKRSSNGSSDLGEDESSFLNMTGDYTCACDENTLDRPAPRSYRLWDVQSAKKKEQFKMLVHCSHKARGKNGEVILEPIPEYQPEIGASEIPIDKLRSIAVSLLLRKNASVMFVRIDGVSGEVLSHVSVSASSFLREHESLVGAARDSLQVVLSQLQALLPGTYLLRHEPSHGANALLYAAAATNTGSFTLPQELHPLSVQDEATTLKQPRHITDALLPIHKHRKTLPCAFTPYQREVVRERRKPPARQKTPPRAIRWPVRKIKKKRRH